MHYLLFILLFFDGIGSLTRISKENSAKKDAETYFEAKDYKSAAIQFSYLLDSLKVQDDKASLNLGHCYYRMGDLESAAKYYEKLYGSSDRNIKSIAAMQLGILSFKEDQDKEKALTFMKESLRSDPTNKEARYNYEFLTKLQKGKQDPKMDNKDKKDDKKEDKKEENKKEGDKKEDDKKGDQKDDKKGGDKKDDKKDDKNGKDGKDGKDDKKDQDKKDGKDGKGGKDDKDSKDKKDGKGDKSNDQKDDKNGKDKEGGKDDKKQDEKAKQDKNGENAQGKDDQKKGQEEQAGSALKEKQGGKKEKPKMVANPEILAKMGMTDAKAKMVLDAMKSSEVQYIQQQKRESTKKQKRNKPDW